MNDFINYYELLGVKKDATEEEIRKAYRIQAKKWHPDINKDKEASNITKKLNDAKQILLNETKRKEYDRYLEELTNPNYEKLKEKEKTSSRNTNNNYQQTNYQEEYYKETYTKWEYFMTYLKYYQTPIIRKIIAIILVVIETIICTILQIINYLLALILAYSGTLITNIASLILGLYIIALIFSIVTSSQAAPQNLYDWFISFLILIIGAIFILLPEFILKFLIEKMPIYLSNLNIFLFKKAVGYKEIN